MHAGARPLKIESTVPVRAAPDVSVTLSEDGKTATLFAVNATLDEVVRPLDFSAFGKEAQEVSVWTLADRERAGEPDVTNSFAAPERVTAEASKFRAKAPRFDYRFPALSVTVIQWKVGS
jgi:alpha-L-arabinofuranosidase